MISIVTLAWRNEMFAAGFLESLKAAWNAAERPDIEVIVVVNGGGGTATATSLQRSGDGMLTPTLIELPDNEGFSGGANVGVANAIGETVVVANLDLEFHEQFLAELVSMSSGPWDLLVPAVVPLQGSGPGSSNTGPARRSALHRHAWLTPAPHTVRRVQAGTGSCLVLSRQALDHRCAVIGGLFDVEYHSFYEDVDLFWWAERRGLVALYDPDLVVRHALAGSFGGRHKFEARPPWVQQLVMANWRITVWKNAHTAGDWLGWAFGEFAYLAQATVSAGPAGTIRYFRSWGDSFRKLRAIRCRRGSLRG